MSLTLTPTNSSWPLLFGVARVMYSCVKCYTVDCSVVLYIAHVTSFVDIPAWLYFVNTF